ncbi:transcriptional regulator, TetR family [Jatrophihabitans endophyticus]|uniref:Transcriptional regulator, TetR family n=1 Tax=Jatrophihabitans endophyticus TaxID=1206085 RepID=A0A1M5MGP7_9ACTN|nr:TetR/AcrR family transcriptional regulator [Jatrophihabitans endophyticus]SHG76406.1 transcriptional regulator, TetR family [Jatrophihabitans endophyticus]
MREIARRAGVSHAAPAHHFVDKAGIFTAIATEGFRLAVEEIGPVASGADGFLRGGEAYVAFALTHPGHFEVMFRPGLYHGDDPDLVAARDAAFAVLHGSALAQQPGVAADSAEALGLVLAGWSLSHGFATLWLTANLADRLGPASDDVATTLLRGMAELGRLAERRLAAGPDGGAPR